VLELWIPAEIPLSVDGFVAEATEVISVVRIGVSLVEYIYKVFSNIFHDSGASDIDISGGCCCLLSVQGITLSKRMLSLE
jgi:hypothetical protein